MYAEVDRGVGAIIMCSGPNRFKTFKMVLNLFLNLVKISPALEKGFNFKAQF